MVCATNGMSPCLQKIVIIDRNFIYLKMKEMLKYSWVFHEFIFVKGHYIYIEAKGNDNQGADKARIISPKIRGIQANDREAFCVVFWYYMFGDTVGELNVYLRNESSPNLGRPIWGMAGARGEKWRAAEVELNTPEDFYVR